MPLAARRVFFPAVALILASTAAIEVASVLHETATFDEPNQLVSGYGFLRTGRYTRGLEHPPLAKLLFALPLLPLPDRLPPGFPANATDDRATMSPGNDFLYKGVTPADQLLLRGRLVAIAIRCLLGFAIAWWARRWFSPAAALAATWIYAFDPNFLAHGRYIKNDVAAALLFFAACASWGEFLRLGRRTDLVLSGLWTGLALGTKFSALLLGPVFLALMLLRPPPKPIRKLGVLAMTACLALWACYGFEFGPVSASTLTNPTFRHISDVVPVPAPSLFRGLSEVFGKEQATPFFGHYAVGNFSWTVTMRAPWYLSAVAFAVKTPVADLLLFCAAAFAGLNALAVRLREKRFGIPFHWLFLSIPPLIYFIATCFLGGLNAGTRHLLPVYPFLFVLSAGLLWDGAGRAWGRPAVVLAAVLLAFESFSVYPHYLAFFNALSGGPTHGPEYLIDSNIDWGQDALNLRDYLVKLGSPEACVAWFGMSDLDYYRVPHRALAAPLSGSAVAQMDCLVAVSATLLYFPGSPFRALLELPPDDRIGYSVYIYDLRKHRPAPDP